MDYNLSNIFNMFTKMICGETPKIIFSMAVSALVGKGTHYLKKCFKSYVQTETELRRSKSPKIDAALISNEQTAQDQTVDSTDTSPHPIPTKCRDFDRVFERWGRLDDLSLNMRA